MIGADMLTAATALPVLLAAALGYALGAIPFGLVLTRLAGTPDIRSIGSGNIGATNVLRTGRKGLAAATLFLDMIKGTLAVLLARALWGGDAGLVAGLFAFLGHLFPIWLRFKGGKGAATFVGVVLALSWPAALVFGGVWLTVAAVTRYSSLASLLASAATPVALWLLHRPREATLVVVMAALIWIRHHANIGRLSRGEEPRIGAKP